MPRRPLLPRLLTGLLLALASAVPAAAAEVPAIEPLPESGDRETRDAALVIGVEAYDQLPQATYARADARAWRDWLVRTRGVRSSRVTLLEDPTGAELGKALKRAASAVRSKGTMWVVFAGHGAMTAAEGGERTLLLRDAQAEGLSGEGLPLRDLAKAVLRSRRASRVVFVLDASFDGRGRDGLDLVPGARFVVPDDAPEAADKRVVLWMAARGAAPVDAWSGGGHGTFTWGALGALRGWADGELDGQADGHVTLREAHAYTRWTGRQLGRPVEPALLGDASHGDLVLARGRWLEQGPTAEAMAALSEERRRRRYEDLEALMRAEAAAFWQATLEQAQAGGEAGREALQRYIAAFEDREITLSWTVALPEVRQARQLLERYDEAMAQPTAPEPEATAAVVVTDPVAEQAARVQAAQAALQQVQQAAQAAEEARCDDLVALEPQAMIGGLSPGQLGCLELRVRTDRLQTDREKASQVLIVNAQAAGDPLRWASLVERHLNEISRADPALVMTYAVYLFRTDPVDFGEDAIHWAEVALENKARWEGETHIDNVSALFRVRAEAAYKMWIAADQAYRASPSEDAEWQSEEYRGWTKDYAREWLDFLRAAGRDTDRALQICTSAAGTADFCRAR